MSCLKLGKELHAAHELQVGQAWASRK